MQDLLEKCFKKSSIPVVFHKFPQKALSQL